MTKKIILVTGASSGIGAAIAGALVERGHEVHGTSRSGRSGPPGVRMHELDVCSDASVARCVDGVLARSKRIDALVNNAGHLLAGAIEEVAIEDAKAQFETNFFGVARMVRAVLPAMRARESGTVITISSLAGLVPVPFWGLYNATKFAVEGYMETLRHELRPFGIKVAMVEPGAIKTALYAPRDATQIAAYSPWRERALKTMRGFEKDAPGPELVARRVARIVDSKNPALRNRVTSEASIFSFLRWLLPAAAFEIGIRRGFHLDSAGYELSA